MSIVLIVDMIDSGADIDEILIIVFFVFYLFIFLFL